MTLDLKVIDYVWCCQCKQQIRNNADGIYYSLDRQLSAEEMINTSSTICPECLEKTHPTVYENVRIREYTKMYGEKK